MYKMRGLKAIILFPWSELGGGWYKQFLFAINQHFSPFFLRDGLFRIPITMSTGNIMYTHIQLGQFQYKTSIVFAFFLFGMFFVFITNCVD